MSVLKDVSGISNWDFSGATTVRQMFYDCKALNTVQMGGTLNCNVYGLFQGCTALESVKLDVNLIGNSIETKYMFSNCSNLNTLNLSGSFTKVSNFQEMFNNCNSLTATEFKRAFATWKMPQNTTNTDKMRIIYSDNNTLLSTYKELSLVDGNNVTFHLVDATGNNNAGRLVFMYEGS